MTFATISFCRSDCPASPRAPLASSCGARPGMMRSMILTPPDHEAIATEALAAMDRARQIAPFSVRYPGLSLDDAYRISARLCALRTARGERVIGRKIGFTNRTIWSEYGVYAPITGLA